jgi:hypothetical protein
MKSIEHKIAEIRQQPEHIRLRYVWGSVAICMVAVLAIWFISIKASFMETGNSMGETADNVKNQFNILEDSQEAVDSFNDTVEEESTSIDKLLEEARQYEEENSRE